jgi:hypothetical protein
MEIFMPSVLYHAPVSDLTPAQAIIVKRNELAAHHAVMTIVDQVREQLPRDVKDYAAPAAAIGIISALGRIFADHPNQLAAHVSVLRLSEIVAIEQRYWLGRHQLH